ncbi:MAG: 3-hydroxybutyryl-CoA dehydrogenase [Calditrichaeota bacterium]|nr:3-hydroxybutyryl-CoA dehydrogenase [Calditrichota bacterium]
MNSNSDIRTVGVAGCGLMGSGIALASALAGFPTTVREVDERTLDAGLARLHRYLGRMIEKERASEDDRKRVNENLAGATDLRELAGRDLIIEAVPERLELKAELFRDLDAIAKPEAIFASNTSSLKIREIAAATNRRDRFLGLHFFNPAPVMKLVEVVRADEVSEQVYAAALAFVERLGKVAVACRDTTGFVVNRLLVPYLLDAIRAFEAGVAGVRDIDNGMMYGCGYPMGPLALLDFIGHDTTEHVADVMTAEFGREMYRAPRLLRAMVAAGMLGKKSGGGFYDYSGDEPVPNDDRLRALVATWRK